MYLSLETKKLTIINYEPKKIKPMKKPCLLIVFTVLLYGAIAAQNSNSNNPNSFPASQSNISISEGGLDQNSSVWGSVENLKNLKKLDDYLTVSGQLNISIKQILPNSKNPILQKVYEFSCNCNEQDLYRKLTTISGIKGLEYGPKYNPLVLPNDYNLTFSNMYSLDLINAEQAWGITHGDCNVGVAVSDQNYYPNHPELVGKITYYDQANNATRTHGTAVATVVAANTNNGVGFSSIGYNLSVALYRMNYNEVLSASYAGAKVVNLSWASGCSYNQYVQDAINEVYDNGTFIVAAAGNGGTCGGASNLVYPAAYNNVFAVTSIGPNDNHERTIGNPLTTHQHNSAVDLSAPGYDVPLTPAPGWYLTSNGTSFAAPYVTGTVGLMLCANPCLLNEEIETILKNSSVNIDALNPSYAGLIGAGRLDAGAAVTMAFNSQTNTNPCGITACNLSVSLAADVVNCGYNISCYGANDGSIATTSNGSNLTYAWSNGSSGAVASGLGAGTYSVTVIDGFGCSANASATLTEPDPLVVDAGQDQAVYYGYTPLSCANLSGSATGGCQAYGYNWSNGHTTNSQTVCPSTSTSYTLTVTDNNGCTANDVVDICVVDVICYAGNSNNQKVEMCHVAGNGSSHDICISPNAVPAHLAHGCSLGACSEINACPNSSARISNMESTQHDDELSIINLTTIPNPFDSEINISLTLSETGTYQLEVLDIFGRVIESINSRGFNAFENQTINVQTEHFTKGMYLIRVIDVNSNYVGQSKLIIKN